MRILLPPSEAKAAGGDGPSLRATGFGDGPLAEARVRVTAAVAAFCRDAPEAAVAALRLPATSAAADLAANVGILDLATMPALDRFTGVLYEALSPATLSPAERAVADRAIVVCNAAFGLTGATEPIPDHRVPMAATIPGLGPGGGPAGLGTFWRALLGPLLPGLLLAGGPDEVPLGEQIVVDLRSSDYATVPRLSGPLRANTVPVRALTEKRVGRGWVRRPLSYQAKQVKGLLTRSLIQAEATGRPLKTIDDLAEIAAAAGLGVERGGTAAAPTLDVITRWDPAPSGASAGGK
ncbi:peroxide stress protein YaaA [Frankia sp. CNm7]|uniref:Peroxide stress protein YaaA n=1 Tax=Frankia nepalensis TaxID=1836974 RepID=A0A937R732_9ACTN|nr:peroxide stress protein YaaA [Frankia nepalensis]MBL7496833.1 peroxide stress protein YaaA [Frankia nepalensis]MBL7510956.1 peroxide stress protein YaaA [Frankia nepalensis]MBL7523481.1 peroxide stress protein YaaA [Frankia nepalensis]MBL7626913.1 peroxide stress protein YaaA [Frankia nepalensis]